MTQIIFHIAAIACIVYTVCRFGLFIHKRMRKNKNIGKHVHVPPPERMSSTRLQFKSLKIHRIERHIW